MALGSQSLGRGFQDPKSTSSALYKILGSHFQQKDLIIHRVLKGEVRELSSLYFRAKSWSMKVRLFHFKSPPTATNANWASKWYYKSLRWDFSQNKTQQCKKETSRKQSCCFTYGNDSQQGTSGNAWRSVGLSPGTGDNPGSWWVRDATEHPTMHRNSLLIQDWSRSEVLR